MPHKLKIAPCTFLLVVYLSLNSVLCHQQVNSGIPGSSSDGATQQENVNTDGRAPIINIKVPYSSSPLYLTRLAQAEQYIHKSLVAYENELLKRLALLQRLRTDFEGSVVEALKQAGGEELNEWTKANIVSSHPILSYRMIRRFATDLQTLKDHLWLSLENELWQFIESNRGNFIFPTQDDLISSAISLINMQETHDFNIHHFADGAIGKAMGDQDVKVGLTGRQCLEISDTALQIGYINAATEWFQAAHTKGVDGTDTSVSMDELTKAWEKTYKAFLSIWSIQAFRTHDVFREAKEMLQEDFQKLKKNLTKEHSPITFKALCRGDRLLKPRKLARLICYSENTIHPYHFINPLRVEIFSWNPLVYQVHDFIGVKQLGEIGNIVVSSMVTVVETGQAALQVPVSGKTYTYSSILDSSSSILANMSKRLEMLPAVNAFGFKSFISDHYKISSFAVGNHYDPCNGCFQSVDVSTATNIKIERTVSAVHIVLHQPVKGGDLAFPLLGITIPPILGSAVIFNEIDSFGNIDERTMHGSCPVLIGEKWIATKLFH